MNNIKTIEVIKPVFGLNVGDTLTRSSAEDNFVHDDKAIGDGYVASKYLSIDKDAKINWDSFQTIEWFMSKKAYKALLKKQEEEFNKDYTCTTYNALDYVVTDLQDRLKYVESELEYERYRANNYAALIPSIRKSQSRLSLIEKRIDTKINEFSVNLEKVNKVLELELADDSFLPQVKESVVVFSNMIDLLTKIKA